MTSPIKLDRFHVHEALHAASMLAEMVEAHLAAHPAIAQHPLLAARAELAVEHIQAIYQMIPTLYPEK